MTFASDSVKLIDTNTHKVKSSSLDYANVMFILNILSLFYSGTPCVYVFTNVQRFFHIFLAVTVCLISVSPIVSWYLKLKEHLVYNELL